MVGPDAARPDETAATGGPYAPVPAHLPRSTAVPPDTPVPAHLPGSTTGGEMLRRLGDREDAWPMVMGIVSVLLLMLAVLVLAVGFLATSRGIEVGGPDPMLTAWSVQHAELTGFNAVGGLDGDGVSVCIVDSGVDLSHPDLASLDIADWHDFVNELAAPYDDEGHGTSMVGILVADGGLNGHAKGIDLLVAKAMNDDGQGEDDIIAAAVDWCVTSGSDIVSLSLGGAAGFSFLGASTDALEQSVQDALDAGVYIVAAAGNDGQDDDGDVESPGSVEDVICVGGATRGGTMWAGSSRGDNNGRLFPPMLPRSAPDQKPELVAPGHEVPILIASGTGSPAGAWWGWSSGTSDATVYVTAAVALMLQAAPEMKHDGTDGGLESIEQVKTWIEDTSEPLGAQTDHDDHAGYGRLRADRLVDNASGAAAASSSPVTAALSSTTADQADLNISTALSGPESVVSESTSPDPDEKFGLAPVQRTTQPFRTTMLEAEPDERLLKASSSRRSHEVGRPLGGRLNATSVPPVHSTNPTE